jgi:flagellar L-ring protein precursor FlgH
MSFLKQLIFLSNSRCSLTFWLALLLFLGFFANAPTAVGQTSSSLWQRRDPVMLNPYLDAKARRPGDLLVVQINERSDVDNRDLRLMQKNNRSKSDASVGGGVSGFFGSDVGEMSFDQESAASRQFNGNSQFRSERGFIDQFTVTIVDITPNGNLLISGKRQVGLEGDTRTLVLTGMVRAVDITAANTIPSSKVANLDIQYEAREDEGAERRFINQGWLGKKLNKWWPY